MIYIVVWSIEYENSYNKFATTDKEQAIDQYDQLELRGDDNKFIECWDNGVREILEGYNTCE